MLVLLQRIFSLGWTVAGFFGALVFLTVAGLSPLDVTNIAWLGQRPDPTMNQLGWSFFRHAPWGEPIALNPNYGMEFAGSILFADAIPILAIPLKGISAILPEPFQYFGWWAFASFVLQGVFGWLLMSRATENPAARLLGAIILTLTPVYCQRLVGTHFSLTAHWMILAALTLCLTPKPRRSGLYWCLLLTAAVFVHPYILAMCAALWCADFVRRALLEGGKRWFEPLVVVGSLSAVIVLTGVFVGPASEPIGGFGWFKMNILTFIDSDGWSYVLPDIPTWGRDDEGFAFLGLGGLGLVAIAAWSLPAVLRMHTPSLRYAPLALVLAAMWVFALSCNVTIGPWHFYLTWPQPLQTVGEIFRATGRFVWPLYYFVFFAAVFIVSRRLSARALTMVLAFAAVVQAIDTVPGWMRYRSFLTHSGTRFDAVLTSPFWDEAGRRYKAVRVAPHRIDPRFLRLRALLSAHGMATDAVYLARISSIEEGAADARIGRAVATGMWPSDTLFILDEDIARRATCDRDRDFLVRVDGLIVMAPAWKGCSDCGAVRLSY